ncbi:MAG: protein-L-isoaspartate(D-aspartate) O-methyltransferase [Alphaproteobacteria bacterium]|nr:protein-L-isoaspartate(D-aspartate) O-methyltransferase [Alphaproteobacteria bacterium]
MHSSISTHDKKVCHLILKLREQGITEMDVLEAIERVPREIFVPPVMRDRAYEDIALPIGRGQTISQPSVVALMTRALELSNRHTVLEIGTGSGYQTCILAWLARRVYSIERHVPLLKQAEVIFRQLNIRNASNITAIAGDGMKGWPQFMTFDRIIVTAAARTKPPQALLDQLKVGGLMVVPVGDIGDQVLRLYKKESEDTYALRDLAPVRFVPLLPEVVPEDAEVDIGAGQAVMAC